MMVFKLLLLGVVVAVFTVQATSTLQGDACTSNICEVSFYDEPELSDSEKLEEQNSLTQQALSQQLAMLLNGQPIRKTNIKYWELFQAMKSVTYQNCPLDFFILNTMMRLIRFYISVSQEKYPTHLLPHVNQPRILTKLRSCASNTTKIKLTYGFKTVCQSNTNATLDEYISAYESGRECVCQKQATGYEIGGMNNTLQEFSEDSKISSYDLVLETFWLIFQNAYYSCSSEFQSTPVDLSRLYIIFENIIKNDDLIFRWYNSGLSFGSYSRVFPTRDLNEFIKTFQACVRVAQQASNAPTVTRPTVIEKTCQAGGAVQPAACVTPCSSTTSSCTDGRCVPTDLFCNGRRDCLDGSDEEIVMCESFCKLHQDAMLCDRTNCVRKENVCDGTHHCRDFSDERCEDCRERCFAAGSIYCNGDRNKCISPELVCNGIFDCSDGSDELEDFCRCNASGSILCSGEGNKCIGRELMCNGQADCADGSDEADWSCLPKCDPWDFYTCTEKPSEEKPGRCVAFSRLCDGKADCAQGSDEDPENCKATLCSDDVSSATGSCQPGWDFYKGTCYRILQEPHVRNDPFAECKSLGGIVGRVFTQEQNDWILSYAQSKLSSGNLNHRGLILGAYRSVEDASAPWVWESDSHYECPTDDYTNWNKGEPNGDGNYVIMYVYLPPWNGKWNDQSVGPVSPVLCTRVAFLHHG